VTSSPATAGRPRFDIADIVRRHRPELEGEVRLTPAQSRVLSAIAVCRTAALGGHLDVCRACGYEHPFYNSCRNRHCPKCQALAQERWINQQIERVLPTGHFHVVFTLPSELRGLAKFRPALIFDALFRAAGQTLLELGHTRFDGTLGAIMVLHTWTRELAFHPHVHAIVTAGGVRDDCSRWNGSSPKYLFPVNIMGALLRGKMMAMLRRLHADGEFDGYIEFADPRAFDDLMLRLANTPWIIYAKKPFRRCEHVLAYLGRYTHRVAISNSRLVEVTPEKVVFRTRGGNTTSLRPVEFLRRFVQHVLPDGMQKIRYYGLYARSHVKTLLPIVRALFGAQPMIRSRALPWEDHLHALTGRDVHVCRRCGQRIVRIAISPRVRDPPPRGPPHEQPCFLFIVPTP
jgi:hypothetical protein